MSAAADVVHAAAVAVAVDADGPLAGVLILGPSGSGKSSLALSLIEACPFHRTALVADDAVRLERVPAGLAARAPDRIAGLIEVRGFGPASARSISAALLRLAVDLGGDPARMPEPKPFRAAGDGPPLPLYPFLWRGAEATAAHRVRRMVAAILDGQTPQRTQDGAPALWIEGE